MYVSILEFAGNGPKRGNGPRCVLCVQNARQTPVQNGVLGLEKQLQSFAFYAPIWPLFPSCLYRKNGSLYIYTFVCLTQFSTKYIYIQSRIYACNFLSLWKYKTPRRWEGLIFFPLKILKRRRTAANFSLNKDGGVFNGTMYIPFAFSCKNALCIRPEEINILSAN